MVRSLVRHVARAALVGQAEKAESLFRQKVLSMLLKEGRITRLTVERLLTWHHSGFNVHAGERVEPEDKERREHLARYLARAPLALDNSAHYFQREIATARREREIML